MTKKNITNTFFMLLFVLPVVKVVISVIAIATSLNSLTTGLLFGQIAIFMTGALSLLLALWRFKIRTKFYILFFVAALLLGLTVIATGSITNPNSSINLQYGTYMPWYGIIGGATIELGIWALVVVLVHKVNLWTLSRMKSET